MTQSTTQVVASGESGNDLIRPEFTTQLLAAIDAEIDIEDYLAGRAAGATHDELLAAKQSGVALDDYASARQAGATHSEIRTIAGSGRSSSRLAFYGHYRNAGISHAEAMGALATHSNRKAYLDARKSGATHVETMEADSVGMSFYYAVGRGEGMGHDELLVFYRAGVSLDTQRELRKVGVTVADVQKARDEYPADSQAFEDYLEIREGAVSHDDTIDAVTHLSGKAPGGFVEARRAGASHAEVIAAAELRVSLFDYAEARDSGHSHADALAMASC